jgi:hypothetical protein
MIVRETIQFIDDLLSQRPKPTLAQFHQIPPHEIIHSMGYGHHC